MEKKKNHLILASVILSLAMVGIAWAYKTGRTAPQTFVSPSPSSLEDRVMPLTGIELPVSLGNLGLQMVEAGVINPAKLGPEYQNLFVEDNRKIRITRENSGRILNFFWAFGLANKSRILDAGEMADPAYGGPENFASTAGWTAAQGDAMNHYSRHAFVTLSEKEQALVEKVAKGIYRPCCGNSTYFPDCNHGMAMLGLLELMASQGAREDEMWRATLATNAYWFPDAYLTIASYLESQGTPWEDADPREILGAEYSSAQGFRNIAAKVVPVASRGSSCGL